MDRMEQEGGGAEPGFGGFGGFGAGGFAAGQSPFSAEDIFKHFFGGDPRFAGGMGFGTQMFVESGMRLTFMVRVCATLLGSGFLVQCQRHGRCFSHSKRHISS
eukprot:GHRR01027956.1.p1 GENE.GHRR01027956.1~~GHRR01027956.1.p1  ORF type:complete len:103 (+),score=16.51 GHRR01027956.1:1064-1372(+)